MSKLPFDVRSPDDWLKQAQRFDHMAERFKTNPELSSSFRALAADARGRAEPSA